MAKDDNQVQNQAQNQHPARKVERVEDTKPKRVVMQDGHRSPFTIDEIPADTSYRWVRYLIAGVEDQTNVDQALMDGYTPVPVGRHKGMTLSLNPNNVPEYIQRVGHILMERPMYVAQEQKEALRRTNAEQLNSVLSYVDGASEKDLNLFTEANKVTRTRTFQ